MDKVSVEYAFEKLKRDILTYADEIDNLNILLEDEEPVECFADSHTLIIANQAKDAAYLDVIPSDGDWDAAGTVAFISEKYSPVNIRLDVSALSEPERERDRKTFLTKYNLRSIISSYGANAENYSCNHPMIRELTPEDEDLFASVEQEQIQYRPTPARLFEVFIKRKAGKILAYFHEGKIAAYLSYTRLFDGVYDVDYVYVCRDFRNRGIGSALAKSYLSAVSQTGKIALWTNAKNEASVNTAMSAGFRLTTIMYCFGD